MSDIDTQFWFAASTEEFLPSEMLAQARAAEDAGFDGTASSDHFAPWFPDGRGSHAWAFLAAAGAATTGPLGTSVTPLIHHYHPAVVAQAFMSLEDLYPGRVFLGAGSGEALNEVPLGLDWPPLREQQDRLERALEAITRLWPGEIILQSGFHLGPDEQSAIASARKWKPTQLPEVYTDDVHDPAEMVRIADERMSDEEFAHQGFLVGADPEKHVTRLREMLELGPTVVCLQGIGDADPIGSIRRHGAEVLPALRRARV